MKFEATLPSLRAVAENVTKQQWGAENFAALGVENWEQFWAALGKELALAELFAERELRFAHRPHTGTNASYALQSAALQEAGFREVGVIWQHFDDRVLLAVR